MAPSFPNVWRRRRPPRRPRQAWLIHACPRFNMLRGEIRSRTLMNEPSPPLAVTNGSFLRGYRPLAQGFDEIVGPDGQLRDHWKTFATSLDGIGMTEFVHRWDEAKHILR